MKANIEKVSVETIKDAEALAEAIVDSEYGCKHDVAFLNYYALNILRHDCLSTIEQFKQKIVNDLSAETKAFFREAFAKEKEEPAEPDWIIELRKEYAAQDNLCTAYPYIVCVQELYEKAYDIRGWRTIEFFFTQKGAEDFIARNKHNYNTLRTFIQHVPRDNHELCAVFAYLKLKMKEQKEEPKEEEERFYEVGQFFKAIESGNIYILVHTASDCWQLIGKHYGKEYIHVSTSVDERLPATEIEQFKFLDQLAFEPIEITIKQNEVKHD